MAKQKEAPAAVNLLDNLMAAAEKQFGAKKVYTATEQEKRTFGIEPYSLALQWMIDCNVVPLQSIIQLAGPPKTYKTSALLYFASMFMPAMNEGTGTFPWPLPGSDPVPGVSYFINTEGKMSPTKITSILRENTARLKMHPCSTVDGEDGWQPAATGYLNKVQEFRDKILESEASGGKKMQEYYGGYIPPICYCIDSLSGSQTEEMIKNVQSEGGVGRTFQDRALFNTNWFSSWSSKLVGLPVLVLVSNHEKDPVSADGSNPGYEKRTPGGVATSFMLSLDIRVSKIKEIKKAKEEGALLKWRVDRSSIGIDKRHIQIPYIETYDEAGNQIAWFDWDEAFTLWLLERQENDKSRYPKLAEVIKIAEHETSPKTYSCEQLGITKDQKCTAAQLGRTVQTNPDLRQKIREAVFIHCYRTWRPKIEMDW